MAGFVRATKPDYQFNWHHRAICGELDMFVSGKTKKLMLFVPPQHGKSELSTRRFPAYALGKDPKKKIAICSYSDTLATSFNRDIQRIIDDTAYHSIFPDTTLNRSNVSSDAHGQYLRNSMVFETVGHRGFVKTVGVGGSLTGTTVDIGIIDDPFKDREEAMSLRIRDKVWSWYIDVFETRLHNDSQQLLVMTRWDMDDLAGRILKRDSDWRVVVYPAIKQRPDDRDPRQIGEALWPSKHSLERLSKIQQDSPYTFNSLYQQEPRASREALVFPDWQEAVTMPNYNQVFGLDFGFSKDPVALIEIQKHNKNIYLREWLYKTGLLNSELITFIKTKLPLNCLVIADSAEPKSIEELRRAGINIKPAVKGPDSRLYGINHIKDHTIHVHTESHNLKTELMNCQWGVDGFDHLLDAARYAATHKNISLRVI